MLVDLVWLKKASIPLSIQGSLEVAQKYLPGWPGGTDSYDIATSIDFLFEKNIT